MLVSRSKTCIFSNCSIHFKNDKIDRILFNSLAQKLNGNVLRSNRNMRFWKGRNLVQAEDQTKKNWQKKIVILLSSFGVRTRFLTLYLYFACLLGGGFRQLLMSWSCLSLVTHSSMFIPWGFRVTSRCFF